MDQEVQATTIDLEGGSEWRFELENDENIAVKVSVSFIMIGADIVVKGETSSKGELFRRNKWDQADLFFSS
jgi:hypothetical protein